MLSCSLQCSLYTVLLDRILLEVNVSAKLPPATLGLKTHLFTSTSVILGRTVLDSNERLWFLGLIIFPFL